MSDDVTEQTSSTTTMRTVHMFGSSSHNYQPGEHSTYLSRRPFPHLPQPRLHDFAPPSVSETTPPSFLSLPPEFGDNRERQMSSSVSSSSPSSNGHIMTSLTSSNDVARMSGHMTSPIGNAHPSSSTNCIGGNLPYPTGNMPGTSRLNHHTSEHIGGSSAASSNLPSTSSSFLNRPDSLCSNSNDSGLSDINCGYGGPGEAAKHHQHQSSHHLQQGMIDGRPKIWSLAHVATSEAGGYMGNGHHHLMNGSSNNGAGGGDIGGNINNNHHIHINNNNTLNKAGMIGGGYGLPPPPPPLNASDRNG